MEKEKNVSESRVDITEIVFTKRNKDYGAYFLRRLYPKNLKKATLTTVILFSIAISSPIWLGYIIPPKKEEVQKLKILDYTQLSQPPLSLLRQFGRELALSHNRKAARP